MHLDGGFMNSSKTKYYIIFGIFIVFFSLFVLSVGFASPEDKNIKFLKLEGNYLHDDTVLNDLNVAKNKNIIIIGDSRFEQITMFNDKYNIPKNFTFIAKSAMEVNWFENVAVYNLKQILDKRDSNKSYHVVINMGVNDIQIYRPFDESIQRYLRIYNSLISQYDDVHFYLLSINPIVESKLSITQPENIRTNDDINYFNSYLIKFANIHKVKYCSSNKNIEFETDDGIHYTEKTNQLILDYIVNNCVL